jgi:hypothetical protein
MLSMREIAARELGALSTAEALALVLLYERSGDDKFERAARRWVTRVQIDHALRHQEVELLRAAMGVLGTRFHDAAFSALLQALPEAATSPADAARVESS